MKKAGDLLRRMLETAKPGEKYVSVFRSWHNIAGDDIAAHSKILDLKNGQVIIEADHPGWLQIIQLKNQKILRIMQNRYPELKITGLRLVLGTAEQTDSKFNTPDEPAAEPESAEHRAFMQMLERLKSEVDRPDEG